MVANDRYLSRTVVIDVLFSFGRHLGIINYISVSAHSSSIISHRPVD
jgi:hypothetical protein